MHTPASLVQHYGGDNEKVWDRYFRDLESLPPEFKVLGINDYLFVDGYRRVLEAKRRGRLNNIDLLLPVVELRLDKFGGSKSNLSRVNYHIVFSDEVDPDAIEHNFLYALSNDYLLTPGYENVEKRWRSNLTRKSVEELGKLIYETTPADKRLGNWSNLVRGFHNLSFRLEDIRKKLEFHHFEGKYVTAVGKTEWADIKWNHQSAADKKTVINDADVVFISSETVEDWRKSRDSLRDAGVNHHLLDCSDAHYFADADDKDRLGRCYTWIKAAPTFDGLLHALEEPEERIFIGEEPKKIRLIRENKTKYVESLKVSKVPKSSLDEVWFNDELKFSPDLVAIIGNKGSGKSAMADVLGLLGETAQERAFSFLKKGKFREPKDNKAEHFEGILTWKSGKQVVKRLNDSVDRFSAESIKYIPQSFLETICNEVARGEGEQFQKELEAVIFSHVEDAERLGTESLEELIRYKTQETRVAIDVLKGELTALNADIIALEESLTEEHRKGLKQRLTARKEELAAHDEVKPEQVLKPGSDPESEEATIAVSEQLEQAKLERQLLLGLISGEQEQRKTLARLLSDTDKAFSRVENIRHRYSTAEVELAEGLEILNINAREIIELRVDLSPLEEVRELYSVLKDRSDKLVNVADPKNGYRAELEAAQEEITRLQAQLDDPGKEYEAYLLAVETWNTKRGELVGSVSTAGSIKHTRKLLDELKKVPDLLQEAYRLRRKKTAEIHHEIKTLADTYRNLYGPVQQFIEGHQLAKGKFDLNFEVSIEDDGFDNRFFAQLNRSRSGSFCGISESSTLLNDLMEKHDFQDQDSTLSFLDEIMDHLRYDIRAGSRKKAEVSEQLKQGYGAQSLYDFLFSLSYLKPRYTLRMGDKDLHQLSPGERGTLLLIFYLLIDKDDVPLVIDQPEENLDNQTIWDLLVPCIRAAKERRQIFLVTHNPNLAVAGDAEQIVRASIDRKGGNRLTYTSGPIEDFDINEMTLDILEGTKPAFENRRSKYMSGRTR